MALLRGADGNDYGFRFADVKGFLPCFNCEAQFVLGDHILEGVDCARLIPYFEEEGVDHDTGCISGVTHWFAPQEAVVGLSNSKNLGAAAQGSAPGVLVRDLEVPEGL